MKAESIKHLLQSYLQERSITESYDAIDAIGANEAQYGVSQACFFLAGESVGASEDRLNELTFLYPEVAVANIPQLYNDELDAEDAALVRRFGRQLSEMSDEHERNQMELRSRGYRPNATRNDMVQFRQRCVFISANSDKIEIPVVRTGNIGTIAKITWKTDDKTAKAGLHYNASRGEISFAEGESEKIIEVKIIKNHGDKDINFHVKLINPEGIEIGFDNPLTVHIIDHSHFVPSEKRVVENIMNCHPNASVPEVAICLSDELSVNTFKAALQYTCSYANSIPQELALAFELVRCSMTRARVQTLCNVVSNFFKDLPDLRDLVDDLN